MSKSIGELEGEGDFHFGQERQPLDITKEFFTESDIFTKSDLTSEEIILVARVLWYGDRYRIPTIKEIVRNVLLLKRSKGAKVLKFFRDTLKNMRPEFQTKEQTGEIKP